MAPQVGYETVVGEIAGQIGADAGLQTKLRRRFHLRQGRLYLHSPFDSGPCVEART